MAASRPCEQREWAIRRPAVRIFIRGKRDSALAMIHLRLNEKQPSPNPFVNFITALPYNGSDEDRTAKALLRSLAAPIMQVRNCFIYS